MNKKPNHELTYEIDHKSAERGFCIDDENQKLLILRLCKKNLNTNLRT